ncbi:MAG TPA: sugar phosphate isomerase/epimerase, partial [Firmicutes bacterium]|nr:sugar phosphate isomerase/epimerase [Bacillota bacterium]
YLKNNLGRVKTVHLKDMEKNKRKMTEVGTGIIDYAGIYKICAEADFEWVIIEQDDIEIDPWQSIKISLENVKKFRQR